MEGSGELARQHSVQARSRRRGKSPYFPDADGLGDSNGAGPSITLVVRQADAGIFYDHDLHPRGLTRDCRCGGEVKHLAQNISYRQSATRDLATLAILDYKQC